MIAAESLSLIWISEWKQKEAPKVSYYYYYAKRNNLKLLQFFFSFYNRAYKSIE